MLFWMSVILYLRISLSNSETLIFDWIRIWTVYNLNQWFFYWCFPMILNYVWALFPSIYVPSWFWNQNLATIQYSTLYELFRLCWKHQSLLTFIWFRLLCCEKKHFCPLENSFVNNYTVPRISFQMLGLPHNRCFYYFVAGKLACDGEWCMVRWSSVSGWSHLPIQKAPINR